MKMHYFDEYQLIDFRDNRVPNSRYWKTYCGKGILNYPHMCEPWKKCGRSIEKLKRQKQLLTSIEANTVDCKQCLALLEVAK